MSDVVVRAENLGKKYLIGHQTNKERYTALRDVLANSAGAIWKKTTDLLRGVPLVQGDELEEFWALENIDFEVNRGETVGIIGRNGAGKSTLLKILSRITEPSMGRVGIKGRVASLLEVGTGFHPELTGRENIYLNGAVLGMGRSDIDRRFDEIVEFAEVEKHLDTPVKRYSTGMCVRLAFAVAAHLEPEILVIDEVLAVGDAEFQKKCLAKMDGAAAHDGRTVLFVSHNIVAVKQLCKKGLWLDHGQVRKFGAIDPIADAYIASGSLNSGAGSFSRATGDGSVELVSYRVTNGQSNDAPLNTHGDIVIHIAVKSNQQITHPVYGVIIDNQAEVRITNINTRELGVVMPPLPEGESVIRIRIKNTQLLPGRYTASFHVINTGGHVFASAVNSIEFEIAQSALYGTTQVDSRWGCVYVDVEFSHETVAVAV